MGTEANVFPAPVFQNPDSPVFDAQGRYSTVWIDAVADGVQERLTARSAPDHSEDLATQAELDADCGLTVAIVKSAWSAAPVVRALLNALSGPDKGMGLLLLPPEIPTTSLGPLGRILAKFGVKTRTSKTNDLQSEARRLLREHVKRREEAKLAAQVNGVARWTI